MAVEPLSSHEDYSTAIFDRNGWNVAQAARIPSHLNSMSYFLTEILARHIPPDKWGPDDIVNRNPCSLTMAFTTLRPRPKPFVWRLLSER